MQQQSGPSALTIAGLLAVHPEAQSLLGEAGHREILAVHSAADERQTFQREQAARLRYDELRHLVDPRNSRTVNFGVGLLLLGVVAAGLVGLTDVELAGVMARWPAAMASAGLTAVWLIGAWLAAVAARERRRGIVVTLGAADVALGLLLAALRCATTPPEHRLWMHLVIAALVGVLTIVLGIGATVLLILLEPASVMRARRRWSRFAGEHKWAARRARGDAERAAVARSAWVRLASNDATPAGPPTAPTGSSVACSDTGSQAIGM
jgi:hypothetical protein